jgi:dGTPase
MYETRAGILKHCPPAQARQLGALGRRFLDDRRPSLEAQLTNLADEVAYNNHDVDDGLRSGLIDEAMLESVRLYARHAAEARGEFPAISGRRLVHETVRRMIGALVEDLLAESARRIREAGVITLAEVHAAPPLIAFSPAMQAENRELKTFLRENLYRHYQVLRMTNKARRIIGELFDAFTADPRLLPPQYQQMADGDAPDPAKAAAMDIRARAVADYIAGMTDRYAMKEHRRLFGVGEID